MQCLLVEYTFSSVEMLQAQYNIQQNACKLAEDLAGGADKEAVSEVEGCERGCNRVLNKPQY